MLDTDIRLLELDPSFKPERLRTPLKFGSGLVTDVTSFTVSCRVQNRSGALSQGWGNVLLSDLWAYPTPLMSHDEKDLALREVSSRLCKLFMQFTDYAHPVDLYYQVKHDFSRLAREVEKDLQLKVPLPDLAILMCASTLDAAIHDAFGFVNGICSYEGYGPEFMDHDLSSYLGDQFKGKYIADYLQSHYAATLPAFHLVGGVDKLVKSEVNDSDPKDGLPVSLEEWIEKEGLYCFKVKLRGNDIDWDVERTRSVAEVIDSTLKRLDREEFHLSVDSNEMHESPDAVVEYLRKLEAASPLAYQKLLYVEQPTERDLSVHRFDMRPVAQLKPVLADEGITDLERFDLACELGWSGVALKTCKGHSSALLYIAKASELGMPYSVQDLTNPGLSLVHSASLSARILPIMGFEYNSRQYLPWSEEEVRTKHPGLFSVQEGRIETSSLSPLGLGY